MERTLADAVLHQTARQPRSVAALERIPSLSLRHNKRQHAHEQSALSVPEHDVALDDLLVRIDRLPYRQRAVLVLRYFDGLSEAEIADTLRCRPGTVKSLASRALARLREENQ